MNQSVRQIFSAAVACHQQGDLDRAQRLYSDVLAHEAGHLDSAANLAAILFEKGDYEIAAELFGCVYELDPRSAEAIYNRGCCYHQLGELSAAAADYRQCLDLSGWKHQSALDNLVAIEIVNAPGTAQTIRLIEARLALAEDVEKRLTLAEQCLAAGLPDEADAHYKIAGERNPASPVARYQTTTQRLCNEAYGNADGLRARWHIDGFISKNPARAIPAPGWDGSSLEGRSLFVATEQGVGDMAMFASRFNEIEAEQIVMEVDARMQATFQNSFPKIRFLPAPQSSMIVPDIDWQNVDTFCYAGDVFYRTDRSASAGGWLRPEDARAARWKNWLADLKGPRIGISWRGGYDPKKTASHSMAVTEFAAMIEAMPATFVLLQYDAQPAELECFGDNFVVPPDISIRDDLDEVIALTSELDLVLTIDNCNVSFAAAVETPCWLLLPLAQDWRWRARAPLDQWRSRVTPYQASKTGWQETMTRLRADLAQYVEGPRIRSVRHYQRKQAPAHFVPGHDVDAERPKALIVNDTLNSSDWGESIVALGLYDMIGRRSYSMTSLPDYALAGITVPDDVSMRAFEQFSIDQAAIVRALERADDIYFLPAIDPGRAALLRYLAAVCEQRLNKRVHICSYLPEMMTAGLSRVRGSRDAQSHGADICTLPSFISGDSAGALVSELEAHGRPVTLLVGGRAAASKEQLAVAEFLCAHPSIDVTVHWVDHPGEWVAAVAGADRLISQSPFAQQIRTIYTE